MIIFPWYFLLEYQNYSLWPQKLILSLHVKVLDFTYFFNTIFLGHWIICPRPALYIMPIKTMSLKILLPTVLSHDGWSIAIDITIMKYVFSIQLTYLSQVNLERSCQFLEPLVPRKVSLEVTFRGTDLGKFHDYWESWNPFCYELNKTFYSSQILR